MGAKAGRKSGWRGEIDRIRAVAPDRRLAFIWDYYKLWIIGITALLAFSVWFAVHFASTKGENWFFACFANTRAEIGDGSEFWQSYADYAGYDLNEKNLVFVDECFVDPDKLITGSQYYKLLIAYLDSGTLDVLVMEPERLRKIGEGGRLMDLENEKMAAVAERYADRLIWCEPKEEEEYGKERVPVGIDLSGSLLTGTYGAYEEGAALGVNALAPHPEEVEVFLRYVLGE